MKKINVLQPFRQEEFAAAQLIPHTYVITVSTTVKQRQIGARRDHYPPGQIPFNSETLLLKKLLPWQTPHFSLQ